jgi:hypothetical protein
LTSILLYLSNIIIYIYIGIFFFNFKINIIYSLLINQIRANINNISFLEINCKFTYKINFIFKFQDSLYKYKKNKRNIITMIKNYSLSYYVSYNNNNNNITTINKSNSTELQDDSVSILTYIFTISAVLLIIFVLGIIFNLVSLLSIIFGKKPIQPIKLLILNLALADFIYILGIPLFLSNIVFKSWPLHLIGCQMFYLTDFIGMIVGVYTVTALSVERFFEVADEKRRIDSFSNKFKILMITIYLVLVWIFAILFSMPMVFSIRLESLSNSTVICTSNWTEEQINIFFAIKFLFMFIIPYSLITVSSVKLLLFLNKWKKKNLLRNLKQMTAMKTLMKYTTNAKLPNNNNNQNQNNEIGNLNEIKKLNDSNNTNKKYGLNNENENNNKLKKKVTQFLHPTIAYAPTKRESEQKIEITMRINSFNSGASKQNRIRRKASRIVLLIILLFFIQWIPLWIL